MKIKKIALIAFYAFLCAIYPGHSQALEGKIIKIADGDTITLLTSDYEKIKIRLYGIDTPEKKQAFGNRARQFTADKVGNKEVFIKEYGKDRYNRTLGIVEINGDTSLNEELLKAGLAWVYDKYCKIPICQKWKEIERKAIKNKIGLWQDENALPPWNWRKIKKNIP